MESRQRQGQSRRPAAGRVLLPSLLLCWCCRAAPERLHYAIPEELDRGSLVGPLARDLGLSPEELPERKLRLSAAKQYFTVSGENGNLYVSERLDREEMCGESASCSVSFEALVHNPLNVFHVDVAIQDVNDNSPRFPQDSFHLEINELTSVGARFVLGMAEDADVGSNSLQGYELEANEYFAVEVKESPDGSKFAELVLLRALDREREQSLRLVLTAVDGGDPPRSGTAQLCINVTDINDNAPVFAQERYRVSVREDALPGSTVVNVSASDADAGINARITYGFGKMPPKVLQKFMVDAESGRITLQEALDFDDTRGYTLLVEARDGGGLVAHCKVEVEVLDVNDNTPEITVLSVSSPVPEDAPAGTVVALLNVKDPDSGENGQVWCELSGEAPLSLVASSGGSYKVVTASALDREQKSEHRVTVVARDRGSPALSSSTVLVLEVSDVNDNAPVFEEAAYSAYVAENNAAGALVLHVRARDADAGSNGRVRYSMEGGSAGAAPYVSVEAQSGAMYAQRSFDYEQCREFAVVVRAQDGGEPARSSTATVRVFVLDRNDNAPRVLWPAAAGAGADAGLAAGPSPFEMVPRSAEAGYLVAKVVAVDADAGRNAWLSYELVQVTEPALFRVGLHSGEVRTARAVSDRDAAKQRLVAVVKDHGQPALSATATLHVVLAESLQEALPELSERSAGADSAAELQFSLVLALALLSALFLLSVALAVLARGRRSGQPAVLRCLGAQRFSVAGAAFPADFCEGTLPYSYNLCAAPGRSVAEGAWPPLPVPSLPAEELLCGEPCAERSLTSIDGAGKLPAEPNAPQRRPGPEASAAGGGEGAGTVVGGGELSAAEMGAAERRWSLRKRALLWGVLMAALDAAWGQLHYSVPEELPKGSFVGDVAKDLGLEMLALRDRGVRVVSEGRTKYFALHGKTGHLVTAERIDREQLCESVRQCVLRCEVILDGEMQVYSVEVEITDINDNAPKFEEMELEERMSESTAPGSRFPLVEAHDPDAGPNSLQRYELSGDEHFSLAVQAGPGGDHRPELVLEKALDREEAAFHELVLRARDGGEPAQTGTARIRVTVLDANDNAPVFSQEEYTARVAEDVPVGSVLVTITASDADEGLNGNVKYSLKKITAKASRVFELDAETGALTLVRPLDFEEGDSYELQVQARDGGELFDAAKIVITVTDVNDNAPEISVRSALTEISEDAQAGTVVALLHVQDRDSGANGQVRCSLDEGVPFRLRSSQGSYYSVVTAGELDREKVSEYNLTVRAVDGGSPAMQSSAVLALRVLDVNDNAPVFAEPRYSARLAENNAAGALVLTVRATDADWGQNARVRYRLSEGRVRGAPLSSYVSVQAETGALYALRSFDYEEVREVRLWVWAEDGGLPALSSNASVVLEIVDENDNAPQVLYPPAAAPSAAVSGWAGVELAPRSAEPGALVAKVVAVDADAGQNAWLSYELAKATEPGLFRVGLHSGEVRTARFPLARDAARQSLVVVVKDHGRPALSATATLTVVLAESVAELLSELGSAAAAVPGEPAASLTRWLVLAVAAVSCLFLAFLLLLLAFRLRHWRRSQLLATSGSASSRRVPASQFVGIDGVRAFLHSYSHEVSLTADSRKSHLRLSSGSCCDTLPARPPPDEPAPLLGQDVADSRCSDLAAPTQAQPNTDWRFSQTQRPGTSGSQNGEEGGAWPNNQFDTEMLQAMILASANEAADGNSTLGGGTGTMGLSARYGPQFTLQHVPDYRQNVYIPGSTATLTNAAGKRDAKNAGASGGNKKKSGKKEKK
ncbi:protocadherin gamma-A2-like [Pezoporus flaviventris]|uniref:protocadherin gamma-A2-like n=1 Tax=Pezoporus flaviventris TaxID=889875 RepID=UPI002AB1F329|nr:protocadherin gamma-A2-like [Pezoporus flaviventris]